MKKTSSMSKLLSCTKRQSASKLSPFDHSSMIRKSNAALGFTTRAASKRKLDDLRIALERHHNEVDDTKNATFSPRFVDQSCNNREQDETQYRFFRPSNLSPASPIRGQSKSPTIPSTDLPPSLPRRSGSVENTGIPPLSTSLSQQHHQNARFSAFTSEVASRNAPLPTRNLRGDSNPFWDSTSHIDTPPSYHRQVSVNTQLNNMSLSVPRRNKLGPDSKAPTLSLPFQRTVEIRPGVMAKVRGAQETWSCLQRDFYQASPCQACKVELTSIQNLDYVLCPTCGQLTALGGGGGVGLGFTFSDLRRWELGNQRVGARIDRLTLYS
ncbi:hypothetical protein MPSEU_001042000 [Mayamaea pseudoterrestris]|nr:hypothetical protein MPSEU_001042000 [Mayamaea pseudoterrestris]